MIDPKRMERIWAACPELKPECLFVPTECRPHFQFWVDGVPPPKGRAASCADPEDWMIDPLIRDKCVWWLAHRDGAEIYLFDEDQGEDHRKTHLSTNLTWGPRGDEEKVFINVNDPTEACLLACERVLGLEPWEQANG